MRVLIIGYGYVGQAVGHALAQQGHEVTGLRRAHPQQLPPESPNVQLLSADITKPDSLPRLETPFDWVVNTAAAAGNSDYAELYTLGTSNVLRWLSDHPPRQYVYTSSTGVYAQDDGNWVKESDPTEPESENGRALVETEKLLMSASEKGFPAVILRVAGIYGPGRGYWLKQFLTGEARLERNGSRYLNMIHRDDVCGAIVAALTDANPGEVYNVVDNEPVSQRTVFEWLAARLNRPVPPSSAEPARRRAATNKRISNEKLKASTRWALKYPTFREGYESELRALNNFTEP